MVVDGFVLVVGGVIWLRHARQRQAEMDARLDFLRVTYRISFGFFIQMNVYQLGFSPPLRPEIKTLLFSLTTTTTQSFE